MVINKISKNIWNCENRQTMDNQIYPQINQLPYMAPIMAQPQPLMATQY